MALEDLIGAARGVSAAATKAIETSQAELNRLELQVIRLRAALREALTIANARFDPAQPAVDAGRQARLDVLQDFLDGKREGL